MLFEKSIVKAYTKVFDRRYEENPFAEYFTAEELGLEKEPFEFKGDKGMLRGYFYYKNQPSADRLIVFDHGLGSGHNAYMREISTIVSEGYTVFTYDHTGCMRSDGDGVVGFAQSLNDLDKAISAIKASGRYDEGQICVVGHSWGGYSTMNVPALHPDIKKCVAISGFISVEQMICQFFSGALKGYRKAVLRSEKERNPSYFSIDAREGLFKTKTQMLIIHSSDDPIVSAQMHFEKLRSTLISNDNVKYLHMEGKQHNPTYTDEAVKYLAEFNATAKKAKKKKLSKEKRELIKKSFDFKKMTEQDGEVWRVIFDFLK